MRIKEFAQKFHVSTDRIRYYEKMGLLKPARMENGYRQYDKKCEEALQFVLVLKRLGFTLQEIESLLQLQEKPVSSECNIVSNAFMQQKIHEISQHILFYQQAYQALTQVQQLMNENKYEENKEVIQQLITDMYADIQNGGMAHEE
ncbi:MerR family transcriptional regulator [Brevibacillus panacihumi]|uniref:MerR family transcriptional regulator n=1 Tax=Brevibacillus panacihumi TaxID=497735 RepID=A0A3M8DBZ0_9BACL|nr:MerR family transcriptional regulator [Brevibacillus panacihumi]RNB85640.1 MerR family transcriptional regulator [Brevibacillus panacihumi]